MEKQEMIPSLPPVPIVFSANDYFVPYMAAMIQSIMENANAERKYLLFILHKDISLYNMGILKSQVDKFSQFSIEFVCVTEYFKGYDLYVSRGIPIEAYFRLVIPELFSQYEKIIYLDGDMICCTDIAELYDIELGDNLLASSRDVPLIIDYYKGFNKDLIKMDCFENYFISGMLVFNVKKFLTTMPTKELLEYAAANSFNYHDQDVLNIKCEGKVLLLSIAWDFTQDTGIEFLPEYIRADYNKAQGNFKIVHFAGPDHKPWQNFIYVPNFEFFWKYATRTPFIGIILERMRGENLIGFTYREHVSFDIEHRRFLGLKFILKAFLKRFFRILLK
jgi:lipopolysaccharide biosynthesis glycosyltransferase